MSEKEPIRENNKIEVYKLAMHSTRYKGRPNWPEKISFAQALEELKDYYKNPGEVLKNSNPNNPLIVGRFCYWIGEIKI